MRLFNTLIKIEKKLFRRKPKAVIEKKVYLKLFRNKIGLEVGGPSKIFSYKIPIYSEVKNLDGCNFSDQTLWEKDIKKELGYNYFKNKTGKQFICEASNLADIPDKSYDFLIASHCLEHCANPLKVMHEWLRVIKNKGAILLVLPDKRYTFDHKREVTSFNHLLDDYKKDIDENDLTHLPEILDLHDLEMDKPAGNKEKFRDRALKNYENRGLHHHVFDFDLLLIIFEHFNLKVLDTKFTEPHHQIILGQKL